MRKETNAQFVELVNSGNVTQALVIDAIRFTRRVSVNNFEQAKIYLNDAFQKDPDSWAIDSVRIEYNHLLSLSPENYRLWEKYRKGKSESPVSKPNGDYVECNLEYICMTIDGQCVNIYPNKDAFSIKVFAEGEEEIFINLSIVEKIIRIKDKLTDYRHYFE